jgi:diguanylate cyclase (GGDEF)-like protein
MKTPQGQDLLLQYLVEVDKAETKEDACSLAAKIIAEKTSFSRPAVYLWNEGEECLELAGYANHNPSVRCIRSGQGICGRCYRTGEVQVVNDVLLDPDYFPDMSDTQAELAVPIVWHGRVFGVMDVEAMEKNCFHEGDVRFSTLLVGILASVLSHIDAEMELQEGLERSRANRRNLSLAQQALNRSLETLLESKREVESYSQFKQILLDASSELFQCKDTESLYGVVGKVLRERFGYQRAFIFGRLSRKDPVTTVFSYRAFAIPPEEEREYVLEKKGIIGRVAASLEPYICNDTSQDPYFRPDEFGTLSEIAFPIAHGEFLWGILVVISEKTEAFSLRDVEILTILVNSMALVLENIANVQMLQRELQGMRFLHDLVNALSGERDNVEISRKTVSLLTSRFPDTSIYIWLKLEEGCRMVASSALPAEELPRESQRIIEQGRGLALRALESGEICNTPDVRESPYYAKVNSNTLSELDVPIYHQKEPLGTIALERAKVGAFSSEDEELFHVLSRHLGALFSVNRLLDVEEEKARRDALTGIWNRRFLIQYLQETVEPRTRRGEPCCVIMGDMWKFKDINDTYGHAVGDEVLIKSAQAMAAAVGDRGVVGRYGGDEFLVVLGGVSPEEIEKIVRDLSKSLESLTFSVPSLQAYANFGVACFGEDGETSDDVLAAADRRMYESKGKRIEEHCPRRRERSP